jgi:hypothetical protein
MMTRASPPFLAILTHQGSFEVGAFIWNYSMCASSFPPLPDQTGPASGLLSPRSADLQSPTPVEVKIRSFQLNNALEGTCCSPVFFPSERSLQLGPVSDIPSKIYCHALALGVGFSHSEKTLLLTVSCRPRTEI